ncbi:MAG: hypothetical protein ABIK73_09315 [candidate division WOR-3 bacterium]
MKPSAAWKQITTVGLQSSPTVKQPPHDYMFKEVTVREPGFAYVFVSNEHPTYVDVYFDDITVTHTPSPIVSSSDYFAFGLQHTAGERAGVYEQRTLFQSQELQDELNLGWVQFKWRNHDPGIGRFFNVDPIAEKYYYNSTYAFSENRVIDGKELEGLEWESIQYKNKDGSNQINFTISLKVKNSAGLDQSKAKEVAFGIARQTEKSFSGFDRESNTHFKTLVELDFESDIDPNADFYLEMVKEVEGNEGEKLGSWVPGKVDEIGNTQRNRIQVSVGSGDAPDEIYRTGAHEIGHTGGLHHNEPGKNVDRNGLPVGPNNLMRQTGVVGTHDDVSKRTNINSKQLKYIDSNVKKQQKQ